MPPLDKVYDYDQYGGLKVEKRDKVMTITLNAPASVTASFTAQPVTPTISGRVTVRSSRAWAFSYWASASRYFFSASKALPSAQ